MANPSTPKALAPGDKLGKFELIRQIAVGRMSERYLARTTGLEGFEKLVVVKRLRPEHARDRALVGQFLAEARLAATLHHPNITQVHDIGNEGLEHFFSMEYVHGEDLGRVVTTALENGVGISLDAALTLIAGVCAGLHYAHDKAAAGGKPLHVVHREVSPANVIVSYDGGVKLVDFGSGQPPQASRGGHAGKLAYLSPEQCRADAPIDRRSDLFSIGTILYELTCGQLPFPDETEAGVRAQIASANVVPPTKLVPSYPPALEAIVMRALARDPAQRYATALELQGQLEDFAHETRLRVSPLVLARLMGNVFAARLEEWDHARAQGAFFVEQAVLRTLTEDEHEAAAAGEASPGTDPNRAAAPGSETDPTREVLAAPAGDPATDPTHEVGGAELDPTGELAPAPRPARAADDEPTDIVPVHPIDLPLEPAPDLPSAPVRRRSAPPSASRLSRPGTPLPGEVPILPAPLAAPAADDQTAFIRPPRSRLPLILGVMLVVSAIAIAIAVAISG